MDAHLGLPYAGSTSWAALPLMADLLGQHPQMAWTQRHLHRDLWKRSCDEFRRDNPTLLIQRAFATRPEGQVISGLRDLEEVFAAKRKGLFKHYLWVQRVGIPTDPTVTFGPEDCTGFIFNNGSLRLFHQNIVKWTLSVGLDVKLSEHAKELLEDLDP